MTDSRYWFTIIWNLVIASGLVLSAPLIGGNPEPALVGLFTLALVNSIAAIKFLHEPDSRASKFLRRFYR